MSTSEPGTRPPPRTRSNSPMPVPSRATLGASTSRRATGRSAFTPARSPARAGPPSSRAPPARPAPPRPASSTPRSRDSARATSGSRARRWSSCRRWRSEACTSKLRSAADGFAPRRRSERASAASVRPSRGVASVVRAFARPTSRARRIPCGRHGDQRARRRPLRADRGGGRARGRRGAARHIRLAGADGTAAVARHPALHGHLAGHARGRAGAARGARGARRAAAPDGFWSPTRPASTRACCARPSSAAGSTGLAPRRCARCSWPGASLRWSRKRGLASLAGLARHRRGRGPPRAARRAHVRARVLRPVPAAVRELGHGGRRARPAALAPARAQDRARASASLRASAPISRRCPTTRASTSSATSADGRSTWASRCRCAAARGRTSAPRRAGPRRPRSSTTGPPTPSSARSCWRTG